MIGWIVLGLVVLFFIWLIFGPIRMKINTRTNQYEVILPGIFRGMILPTKDFLIFKLWITAVPVKIDPLKPKKRKKDPEKEKTELEKQKKQKKVPIKKIKRMIIRVFKSFTIEKIRLDVDTGDCILNARLIPLFVAISGRTRVYRVNYQEINHLELVIKNRIFNFIKIAIKTFVLKI
jgi:hypothetical protein